LHGGETVFMWQLIAHAFSSMTGNKTKIVHAA